MKANVSTFARRVVVAENLASKLTPPPRGLVDEPRGEAVRIATPGRPEMLQIAPAHRVRVPPAVGMSDPSQRARILHALANHELQAVELFAWALLCFPDSPGPFRRGLLAILADEQRHCRLYIECLERLGKRLGDYPVTGHFWHKIADVTTPLQFVCTMGLTFENANLDFAGEYIRAARAASDSEVARALEIVHADEIRHVRFAWRWLRMLAGPGDRGAWDTYLANVAWPLGPARARGKDFDRASREAAGLDEEFIRNLEQTTPKRPSGAPR